MSLASDDGRRPVVSGAEPSADGGRAAIFLDRDGVINRMVYNAEFGIVDSPAGPDEFHLLPGVGKAIAGLNRQGYLVVVVSNQPGLAKGKLNRPLLDATTDKMQAEIERRGGKIDAVYYCLHHPNAVESEYHVVCECRKPLPGLLLKAARELNINLSRSYMVGDGVVDVLAGQAAGTTTVFVGSRKPYIFDALAERGAWPDYFVSDLRQASHVVTALTNGNSQDVSLYRISQVE